MTEIAGWTDRFDQIPVAGGTSQEMGRILVSTFVEVFYTPLSDQQVALEVTEEGMDG